MDHCVKENGFLKHIAPVANDSVLGHNRLSWTVPPLNNGTIVLDESLKASERKGAPSRKGGAGQLLKTQLRDLLDDFARTREQISQKFLEAEKSSFSAQEPLDGSLSTKAGSQGAISASTHAEAVPTSPEDSPRGSEWECQQGAFASSNSAAWQTLHRLGDVVWESRGSGFPPMLNGAALQQEHGEGALPSCGLSPSSGSTMDVASAGSLNGLHSGIHTPGSQGGSSTQFSTGMEVSVDTQVEGPYFFPEDVLSGAPYAASRRLDASPVRTRRANDTVQTPTQMKRNILGAKQVIDQVPSQSPSRLQRYMPYCPLPHAALSSPSPIQGDRDMTPNHRASGFDSQVAFQCVPDSASTRQSSPARCPKLGVQTPPRSSPLTSTRLHWTSPQSSNSCVGTTSTDPHSKQQSGTSSALTSSSSLAAALERLAPHKFSAPAGGGLRGCSILGTESPFSGLTSPLVSQNSRTLDATSPNAASSALQKGTSSPASIARGVSPVRPRAQLFPPGRCTPMRGRALTATHQSTSAQQWLAASQGSSSSSSSASSSSQPEQGKATPASPQSTLRATSQPRRASEVASASCSSLETATSAPPSQQAVSEVRRPSMSKLLSLRQELQELQRKAEEEEEDGGKSPVKAMVYSSLREHRQMGPTTIPGFGVVEGAKSVARLLLPRLPSSVAWQVKPCWTAVEADADASKLPVAPVPAQSDTVAPGCIRRARLGSADEA